MASGKDGQAAVVLVVGSEFSGRLLVDDRPTRSAGVEFSDAGPIGVAWSVVVGRDRRAGDRDVLLADVVRVVTTSLG
jgi:hypothetical protein